MQNYGSIRLQSYPHLTYCSKLWRFCRVSDIRKLERINERGLLTVFCDRVISYSDLLIRAGVTSLYNKISQDIAIFKIKNRLFPRNVFELFTRSPSSYSLRNSDFCVPRVRTVKYGKHSLRFSGPLIDRDKNELLCSDSRRTSKEGTSDLSGLVGGDT